MSAELERRWDDAIETAWREFRQRLADRLAELEPDTWFSVACGPEDEAAPWCRVGLRGGLLRIEAMRDGDTDFSGWLAAGHADQAAVAVVDALRNRYGVLHPVYLDAGGLEPEGAVRPLPPKPRKVETDLNEVVQPTSLEDVRAIVDLAVADLYDETPEWDEDGDLALPTETRLVWVAVNTSAPRVLLSCLLLDEVDDRDSALVEVNRLNRTEFGLTFSLTERRIAVTRELSLAVAIPVIVQGEIQRLLSQVDGWARDLDERVSTGQEAPTRRRPNSRFATAYAVMAELERDQRGSVSPVAMARIYGNDTGLLLKAIRITEQRRREMRTKAREARVQGQRAKEKTIRARHDYLRELAARMRAGLRLMVDAPVRKVQLDQLALFDEDEAGTGR